MSKRDSAPATKHASVSQTLRAEIGAGVWRAGARMPSEQELAKRFGVAYMTVRQAVSSLVAEGMVERIPRKGTFVSVTSCARPLAAARQFTLLLEGASTSLDPYYLPPIVEALQGEIRSHGFELSIYDYKVAIRDALLERDAVVCCFLLNETEVLHANLLLERGNPVVAINRCGSGSRVPFIAPDNVGGAKLVVQHLIGLGHRRIGFVRGLPGNIDAADRRHGYVEALKGAHLTIGPEAGNHFIAECGYQSAKSMLEGKNPPTAIFCASDLSAFGALKAIAEAGLKMPEDFSVAGFGDFPLSRFYHPGLTTVSLPLAELGRKAAAAMLAVADGAPIQSELLNCDLVIRSTTAEAPVLRIATLA